MDEPTFTAIEVVQILNDAKQCADRRAELGILKPLEAMGWALALQNIADRFGVAEDYVSIHPAVEAAEKT